jgi:hypothetical protein
MLSTTYGNYRATPGKTGQEERPQMHRGFFIRLMDALAESRQRAAVIEIARLSHAISPAWFEMTDKGR